MIGKKINQLATELAPVSTDLTIIGDPVSGVSKKITLAQLGAIFSGAVSFYNDFASFPVTGDINVIYCAKDTKKLYLWSGSAYVEVFPSQALLDTYQLRSEKGNANGYASLDSSGKVPISQLPSSIMEYKGTWSAATNTPTLANGTGDTGDVYLCNAAGTVNFGAGPLTFAVGDYVVYSGTIWQRSSGAVGTVTSVAASITGDAIGITGSPVTTSGTLAFAFGGNSTQYINGAGNLITFPSIISQAANLVTEVYNKTGATLTKGTIVYINGGQGNLPTVTKAIATGDSTSAQTFGIVQADITNNNNGYVVIAGRLSDLDTQAYTEGTQLYLSSTTAGTWTSTKQYAPAHLVYVGIVVRAHPTQGVVEVKIQNGYELDELHNVAAQTPSNNDGLFWESATSLWKNKSIATILGGTPVTGSGTIYSLTKWGFTSGTIINSNLYDTGSVIYNNNATAGSFAVQFNGNATSGMSYGLLINAGSDANDIAFRVQNVSSTSEYFFIYGDGKVKMNNIPNATTDTDTFLVSDGGFIKYRTGAQLLSDIGGQAALTNPVTGTGTTNYLPKFTGTSTIGDSSIIDNGTNVGIGTATPSARLHVLANNTLNEGVAASIIRQGGQNGNNGLLVDVTNTVGQYVADFRIGNSSVMRLDASGNLGLGVTPSAWGSNRSAIQFGALGAVFSDNNVTSEIGANVYISTAPAYTYITSNFATRFAQINGQFQWHQAPSGTAGNAISFTQAMTLNASGFLGIGTTAPEQLLDIKNSGGGTAYALIQGQGRKMYLGQDGTGSVIYSDGAVSMNFSTNGSEKMRLNASGFLGIGTTAPAERLSVSGAIMSTGGITGHGANRTTLSQEGGSGAFWQSYGANTTTFGAFVLRQASSDFSVTRIPLSIDSTGAATFSSSVTANGLYANAGNSARFYRGANDYYWSIHNDSNNYLNFGTFAANGTAYGSNPKMILQDNGNVGIGTTSPSQNLHVASSGVSRILIENTANAGTGAGIQMLVTSGGTQVGNGTIRTDNSDNMQFFNLGGERMRITSGGNVGIGTTSITSATNQIVTEIYATSYGTLRLSAAGSVKAEFTANNQSNWLYTGTTTNHPYVFATNETERMRITSGGQLLINRTSAASSEEVLGIQAKVNTTAFDIQIGTNSYYGIRFRNSSGSQAGYIQVDASSVTYGTGSDYRLKKDLKNFNGLDLLSKIKTYDFAWNIDNSRMYGVIAHELQSVIPYAVSGTKDAYNKDGSINPQGVDYSKIVPVLIKAIQELNDKIK